MNEQKHVWRNFVLTQLLRNKYVFMETPTIENN